MCVFYGMYIDRLRKLNVTLQRLPRTRTGNVTSKWDGKQLSDQSLKFTVIQYNIILHWGGTRIAQQINHNTGTHVYGITRVSCCWAKPYRKVHNTRKAQNTHTKRHACIYYVVCIETNGYITIISALDGGEERVGVGMGLGWWSHSPSN